jgi:hypothetical protein
MKKISLGLIMLLWVIPCAGRTITLEADGSGDYPTIQAAIDDANDADVIILAPGTYTGDGNRDIDFKAKAITVCSIDPNDPSVVAATVIDGQSDYHSCLEGCYGYPQCEPHRGFNFRNGEGPDSVLAGFTITRFCAPDELISNDPMPAGGGIFCENSSPTIHHCIIDDNWAHRLSGGGFGGNICCKGTCSPTIAHCTVTKGDSYFGAGGIHCPNGSPVITNCIITDNDAVFATGAGIWCGGGATVAHCTISNNYGGGGIYTNGTISYCTIENNTSIFLHHGGGIYGSPAVDHCIIRNNRTLPGSGGGIYFTSSAAKISNSIIADNSAGSDDVMGEWFDGVGGGIYCQGHPTITECTITGNSAARGGGVYGDAAITNCIIWDNTAPNEPTISGDPNVSYSDVEGGWPGLGNIAADPCWADANNGDYHLKSQAGRWDPNNQTWTLDDVTSPCIDAGDPLAPIGSEPFPNGGIVNLGVHAATAEASKSYFGKPPCQIIVAGDINGDCTVNFLDFRLMALHWMDGM